MFLNSNFEIYKYIIFQVIAMARKKKKKGLKEKAQNLPLKNVQADP